METRIRIRHCNQCGYDWVLRNPEYEEPVRCPNRKCQSPFWNKPHRIKKVKGNDKCQA